MQERTAGDGAGNASRAIEDLSAQELIEHHLPLVEHIVRRMAAGFPRHVDRSELVSAGVMGLVEAARRYDTRRGVPFVQFASRRIRGAVLDLVRSSDWAPRSVRAFARQADAAEQALASRLGHSPNVGELAASLGCSVGELEQLRARVHRGVVVALDHHGGDDSSPLMAALAAPEANDPLQVLEAIEHVAYLRDAVRALPERHRAVIVGYFLQGKTSEEVADELGVTQSRVSQLRADALVMLRDGIEAQYQPRPRERPVGRVAKRQHRYAAAIAGASTWQDRLNPRPSWDHGDARSPGVAGPLHPVDL